MTEADYIGPECCPCCGSYEIDYRDVVIPVSLNGDVMQPTRTMAPYCTRCGAGAASMIVEDQDYEPLRQ